MVKPALTAKVTFNVNPVPIPPVVLTGFEGRVE